jgi:hypothetical protein
VDEGVIIEQFNARGWPIANCFRVDQPFLLSTGLVLLSHGMGSQGEAYGSLSMRSRQGLPSRTLILPDDHDQPPVSASFPGFHRADGGGMSLA